MARALDDPDDRPVGEARLTDAEVRERAIFYLTKRQKIEDEKFRTEQEWIHMFSVVGDLGAAMELGAAKDQLELQLEEMAEVEAEIAEKLVEIRSLKNEVNAVKARYDNLGEEYNKANSERDALVKELDGTREKSEKCQGEISQLRSEVVSMQEEIKANDALMATAEEQVQGLKDQIGSLKPKVAEAKEAVPPQQQMAKEAQEELESLTKECSEARSTVEKLRLEVDTAKARIEDLTQQRTDANSRKATLEREVGERKSALDDFPKELDTLAKAIQGLESRSSALQEQLGPKDAELEKVRSERDAAQTKLEGLQVDLAELKKNTEETVAAQGALADQEGDLEAEMKALGEKLDGATKDRDRLMKLVPKLLTKRNSMLESVASTVEEAQAMREELLTQAKSTQERLEQIALDKALEAEEKVLQGTAAQIGLAAQASSEGFRKANEAMEMAIAQRTRAESDFQKLQAAMKSRLAALKDQEEAMISCAKKHNIVEAEVQQLIASTAEQVEQFRSARKSVARFEKNVRRITGIPGDPPAPQAGVSSADGDDVVGAAVGLFGSLLKASADTIADATKAAAEARKKREGS